VKGFVYTGTISGEELRALRGKLGLSTQISWDLARLDFSDDLRDAGLAFGPEAELRWERIDERRFRVILLADESRELPLLDPIAGEWTLEEIKTRLVDLCASQFSPQFHKYPGVDASSARLRCRVFYRDGVALFVSPREVIKDETA
jgi:hypothetical protein